MWQIYLYQNGHLCLSEAILRYGRFTPFKKEQDAILALFKGTQNVVFLKEHVGHSFGRGTPRYSPDFSHPFPIPDPLQKVSLISYRNLLRNTPKNLDLNLRN